jgi:hypothetical protein
MTEYIEREAFKAEVRRLSTHYLNEWDTLGVLAAADRIPAADVRPVVHGKWICGDYWSEGCGMGESYGFYYKCSVCKDVVQGGYKDCGMKYCPNCGADMREES